MAQFSDLSQFNSLLKNNVPGTSPLAAAPAAARAKADSAGAFASALDLVGQSLPTAASESTLRPRSQTTRGPHSAAAWERASQQASFRRDLQPNATAAESSVRSTPSLSERAAQKAAEKAAERRDNPAQVRTTASAASERANQRANERAKENDEVTGDNASQSPANQANTPADAGAGQAAGVAAGSEQVNAQASAAQGELGAGEQALSGEALSGEAAGQALAGQVLAEGADQAPVKGQDAPADSALAGGLAQVMVDLQASAAAALGAGAQAEATSATQGQVLDGQALLSSLKQGEATAANSAQPGSAAEALGLGLSAGSTASSGAGDSGLAGGFGSGGAQLTLAAPTAGAASATPSGLEALLQQASAALEGAGGTGAGAGQGVGQVAGSSVQAAPAPGVNAQANTAPAPNAQAAPLAPAATATPAGAATANTAPVYAPNLPQQLFDQLGGHLNRLRQLGQGEHQLRLAINPETFGPVRVSAVFHADGTATLHLLGASDAAREQLRQALAELRRDLASTGLQADLNLAEDASAFDRPAGQEGRSDGGTSGRPAGGGSSAAMESADDTTQEAPTPRVGTVLKDGSDGSVDMFA